MSAEDTRKVDAGDGDETSSSPDSTEQRSENGAPLQTGVSAPSAGRNIIDTGYGADAIDPAVRKPRIKPPRKAGPQVNPELSGKLRMQGKHPGDRYVKVIRQNKEDFLRIGPGYLVAGEEANAGRGQFGRNFNKLKRVLIGAPLTTASAAHERLTKVKALAVLSSDALSSVAYATEQILAILVLAGASALGVSLPIAGAICVLLAIVGFSYRQTIKAYPHGGGSYIVAKDNLGNLPALVAGGALLTSYTLTVAVSIS
ncbi:MAG TPA: hypothetical protein VFQ54_01390, partial [Thermomicrobiales bacterium]|nr:hypothetical protein [Thermomicrobiales bacterium]